MLMCRIGTMRGNIMNIQIQNFGRTVFWQRPKIAQTRFFFGFAQRRCEHINFTIRMTAELEPTPELPMMREQYRATLARYDPSRGSDMPREAVSMKAVIEIRKKTSKTIEGGRLLRMARMIAIQEVHEI